MLSWWPKTANFWTGPFGQHGSSEANNVKNTHSKQRNTVRPVRVSSTLMETVPSADWDKSQKENDQKSGHVY